MKKIIVSLIIICIISCSIQFPKAKKDNKQETRAIFISYMELNKYVKNDDQTLSKKNIDKMISNIKKMKFNTIILQVRAASDAIYKSKIFPTSIYISNKEKEECYDVLEYFLKQSHKNKIKLFAWINPYRIRTTDDVTTITDKNPAYKYLETDTIYINNGIYYNPSKKEVQELIVKGVKEVLNYDVDAILFDDYFYPDNDIDEKDYQEYLKENDYVDGKNYRLSQVNKMIEKVHKECQKKKVPFGVSPDGNIDNNYNKNYADVKLWMKSNNYIDFIMPQVYYGFYNSSRAYVDVIEEWESLLINKKIDLYIALAFYKVGTEDKYAKEGMYEWLNNDNIIMREVILSRNLKNYKGFALFRYDNVFDISNYTSNSIKEIENLKKILN